MYYWVSVLVALVAGFFIGICAASFKGKARERTKEKKGIDRGEKIAAGSKVKRNIYVGNLAHGVTEEDLTKAFSAFGHVESTVVVKDKFTGRPKGFGFVAMPSLSEARAAMIGLNGEKLKGREMVVSEAHDKKGRKNKKNFGKRRNMWHKRHS